MRRVIGTLVAAVGLVTLVPAIGWPQGTGAGPEKSPSLTVCAPALRGVVRLGAEPSQALAVRRATVELLTGPQQTVLFTVKADRSGRFQLGGGLVKKGTEWLVRVTAPGAQVVTVRLRIDPACREPVLPLSAPK